MGAGLRDAERLAELHGEPEMEEVTVVVEGTEVLLHSQDGGLVKIFDISPTFQASLEKYLKKERLVITNPDALPYLDSLAALVNGPCQGGEA